MSEGQHKCPDCGSEDAVSKSVAWDALTRTPPKVQAELDRLRRIEKAAHTLIAHPGDENTVVVSIPKRVFDAIRETLE